MKLVTITNSVLLLAAAALPLLSVVVVDAQRRGKKWTTGGINNKADRNYDDPKGLPGRIVGGQEAVWKDWTFYGQLGDETSWWCGSSLVSRDWVLTAGHCVEGDEDYLESNGVVDVGFCGGCPGEKHEEKSVDQVFKHPDYDPNYMHYDFALIKLKGSPVSADFLPAAMNLDFSGSGGVTTTYNTNTELWVAGFGALGENEGGPEQLNEVAVKYIPNPQCDGAYKSEHISDDMMCAADDGKDSW